MQIIPVLDLKNGTVVRAEGGRREAYRPISTPLSPDADPVSVAGGLRSLHPFSTFYIADLDAIEGGAPNAASLGRLAAMPNTKELWLDAGFADEEDLSAALKRPLIRPVLGSESQQDETLLRAVRGHPRLILSLDFFADGFRGPANLLVEPELWPQTVIVMTLAKVGSGAGPDFSRLQEVKSRAGNRAVIAAGGIRHEQDLRQLAELGIDGALMATALHQGALDSRQLEGLDQLTARDSGAPA
ncbi:MAG TPA: HisA/HisF-related TIM barrel protein [Rhizobiaceae bacterium]|nr:HisA/HisF-related TIM barrel protein [Rhizobiaceae bacterium]